MRLRQPANASRSVHVDVKDDSKWMTQLNCCACRDTSRFIAALEIQT